MSISGSTMSARVRRALAGCAALALLAAGAAACNSPPATQATDSGTVIEVVAAEGVWGEIAGQIGGPQVHVTDLTGAPGGAANADPAAFEPSAADTKAIAGAQVFILNGAGLDPWANQAASKDPGVGRLEVNVGNVVGVSPGQDPYLWYDPSYAMSAAQQIEQDFAQLRPSQAAYFGQQLQAFDQSSSATDLAMAGIIKQQFAGKGIGTCPGLAQSVASGLGLKPQAATPALIAAKKIKVLLCAAQAAGASAAADAALLRSASAAKIPVVQLSDALQASDTTFQAWLTAQLNQIDQALTARG
jgi:zinc/manganese transport system substrate-binding protein